MSLRNRAVQIVEHLSATQFRANKKQLDEIYKDPRVADLPLVVLCIAGAARKGKSFMLNFFLDYLIHKEKHPTEPWELNDDTRLAGFEFRDGEDRTTLGIWAWNHIFVIEQRDGTKVAVSLIDSQGTFDNKTTFQDCSTIFAMTCMFSSIMCFNVFTDLQEDKLINFATFVDHAKMIADNLGGSGKLFQDLVFIVRDFRVKQYLDDELGGQMYIEKVLGDVKDEELQQLRVGLNDSYERKFGFVLPHPGKIVDLGTTSNIADMDAHFVFRSKEMVETLLSQDEFQVKRIGVTPMRCGDMSKYIPLCVKCFDDHQEFAPKSAQIVNRDFMINLELKRACETYDDLMGKAFVDCETGYENDELVSLHDGAFEQIQDDILIRIKKQDVVAEVIEKFVNQTYKIFVKYEKTNKMLVAIEKKRLEMIEEKRRHEEKLARIKAEAEERLAKEKMLFELRQLQLHEQQERERRQHEKEQAEIAAKLVHDKNEYEKQQAELNRRHEIEMEKQQAERIAEQKRHEEKMLGIQRETEKKIAEGKQEMEREMQRLKKEFEESQKGLFGSIVQGVKDGADVATELGDDCASNTQSEVLGAVVTAAAFPVTVAGGAVFGAAKGIYNVGKTIFS